MLFKDILTIFFTNTSHFLSFYFISSHFTEMSVLFKLAVVTNSNWVDKSFIVSMHIEEFPLLDSPLSEKMAEMSSSSEIKSGGVGEAVDSKQDEESDDDDIIGN